MMKRATGWIALAIVVVVVALAAYAAVGGRQPVWRRAAGSSAQGDVTGIDFRLMRDYRIGGQRVGIVMSDWIYCYPPTGEVIVVPRGYMTDFASIPPAARPFIDIFGNNAEASVAHDWLYAVGEPGKRPYADDLFRYALMEQGVNLITRNLMHAAVNAGGGGAYVRPSEWDARFGDPLTGQPLPASPFARRTTGIVTKVASCAAVENLKELTKLRQAYGSSTWPPASSKP